MAAKTGETEAENRDKTVPYFLPGSHENQGPDVSVSICRASEKAQLDVLSKCQLSTEPVEDNGCSSEVDIITNPKQIKCVHINDRCHHLIFKNPKLSYFWWLLSTGSGTKTCSKSLQLSLL